MKKIVIIGFTGELMCFAHALFNAEEMLSKGWEVKVILEGRSAGLVPALEADDNPFLKIYQNLKNRGDVLSVCRACAAKTGTLAAAEKAGLPLEFSLMGHPSIAEKIENGYEIVTI